MASVSPTNVPASGNGGANNSDRETGKAGANSFFLDPNVYATKKTVAQGLLDVALLTSNASQLKYLLQVGKEHEFYYVMLVLISFSIMLQVLTGIALIVKGRQDINDEAQRPRADFFNNAVVWLVFASTVVHVFLSVFTIEPEIQPPLPEFPIAEPYLNETLSTTPSEYDAS